MKKISKMKSSKASSSLSTSSASSTMLMNGKGKHGPTQANLLDDANLKLLRDLSHLVQGNRHCFDCGQRGPTYVNVTIGSFVCMTCSGLLRGLTPPHRVKSISMASFTPEEMELFKSRGNEYCRKVWLATCSSKDSQLGSEKDPDRMNALKSFMSATYEQKRYYVDPSRLSKSDLAEIQAENSKAVTPAPPTTAGFSINHISSSQKSPSPSSTHSDPSPVLNNLRTNFGLANAFQQNGKPSRLASSMTLPDIKPLTSLIGPSSGSISADLSTLSLSSSSSVSSGNNPSSMPNGIPAPITFINNLVPLESGESKVSNNSSPWGESFQNSGKGDGNDLNPNFADFEDAFNNSSNNNKFNPSSSPQTNGVINNVFPTPGYNTMTPKLMNGGFQPFQNAGPSMQTPMLPYHGAGSNHAPANGLTNGNGISHGSPPPSSATVPDSSGDRYAALKDLDSLFKQNGDGHPQQASALSSSASVPANLSSSTSNDCTTGWFSTSPSTNHNLQNPFSQGSSNGWAPHSNGMNGGVSNGQNPQNPFAGNGMAWGSPLNGNLSNGHHTAFPTSASHMNFSTSVFGTGSNGIGSGACGKPFNPFFPQQAAKSNPNNPFL